MECPDVLEATVARLAGEPPRADEAARVEHLAACAACAAEAKALEETWSALDDGEGAVPSAAWRRETLERLAAETLARKIRPFPDRRLSPALLQVAAVLVAGVAGFLLARQTSPGGSVSGTAGQPMAMIPFKANETLDASRAVPDLSQKPRLANVAYRGADPEGRIGISFDVTTRYTLVGKPEEKGIANLLAYLVSSSGETEGARGKAIDLVSQHVGEGAATSPEIVAVLTTTLTTDKNPGVRKKAAEVLVQLPPTPAIRDAFVSALVADTNPAVRILAVEGLAKAAQSLHDETTIKTLRDKAVDERENGYIRGQAALALTKVSS